MNTMVYGWQLDPFGHSRSHAYISYKMGFSNMVMARIDEDERLTLL
jgi:hypothetical protein